MKYPYGLVRVAGLRNPIQVKQVGGLRFYKIGRLSLSLSVSRRPKAKVEDGYSRRGRPARLEAESILLQCAYIPLLLILVVESVELLSRFLP